MGSIISKAFGPGGTLEGLISQVQAQEQQAPTRLPIDRLYSPTQEQTRIGFLPYSDFVNYYYGRKAGDINYSDYIRPEFSSYSGPVNLEEYYKQYLGQIPPASQPTTTTVSTPTTTPEFKVSGDTGLGSLLSQFAEKLFPEGQFQQIREQATSPEMYNILSNADLARNISNQLGEVPTIGPALKTAFNVVAPVAAGIMSLPYDAIQAAQRSNLSGSSFLESYGRERPIQSAIQRAIGASAPLAEQITPRATFDPSQFKKIEPASFANGGVATLFRKR